MIGMDCSSPSAMARLVEYRGVGVTKLPALVIGSLTLESLFLGVDPVAKR